MNDSLPAIELQVTEPLYLYQSSGKQSLCGVETNCARTLVQPGRGRSTTTGLLFEQPSPTLEIPESS